MPKVQVIQVIPGPPGPEGPSGRTPTKIELEKMIRNIMPDPEPGKDYVLTVADKKEIANSIKVPVVEKVVEKTEVVHHTMTENPLTADELRDKLEGLKEKLSIQAIADLPDILEELSKLVKKKGSDRDLGLLKGSIHGGKGTQIRFIDDETPTGAVDGANTNFVLRYVPAKGSLKVYRGGARQRITEDYTLSGKTITFLVAPQLDGDGNPEIILCDYRT